MANTVGALIKEARGKAKLSQEALAALADVAHIHVVEKDGETITRDYLAVVKKVSDVRSMVL